MAEKRFLVLKFTLLKLISHNNYIKACSQEVIEITLVRLIKLAMSTINKRHKQSKLYN